MELFSIFLIILGVILIIFFVVFLKSIINLILFLGGKYKIIRYLNYFIKNPFIDKLIQLELKKNKPIILYVSDNPCTIQSEFVILNITLKELEDNYTIIWNFYNDYIANIVLEIQDISQIPLKILDKINNYTSNKIGISLIIQLKNILDKNYYLYTNGDIYEAYNKTMNYIYSDISLGKISQENTGAIEEIIDNKILYLTTIQELIKKQIFICAIGFQGYAGLENDRYINWDFMFNYVCYQTVFKKSSYTLINIIKLLSIIFCFNQIYYMYNFTYSFKINDAYHNIPNAWIHTTFNYSELNKIIELNEKSLTNYWEKYEFNKWNIYEDNPVYTIEYKKSMQEILDMIDTTKNIYSINKDKNILYKLSDFIYRWINHLNNNFMNYILYRKLYELDKLMTHQAQEDFLQNAYNNLKIIGRIIKNNYQWWKNKDLGANYYIVMNKIYSIPVIGKDLYKELNNYLSNKLVYFEKNINSWENLWGNIFIDNEFSPETKSFMKILQEMKNQQVFYLGNTPKHEKKIDEICMWDENILNQILYQIKETDKLFNITNNYSLNVKDMLINIAYKNLKIFIENKIIDAMIPEKSSIDLYKQCENLFSVYKKLEQIKLFYNNITNNNLQVLDQQLTNNFINIKNKIKEFMNKTIFTKYDKLSQWNNEPLDDFLFYTKDIPIYLNTKINELMQLYDQIINPLQTILPSTLDSDHWLFFLYRDLKDYKNEKESYLLNFKNLFLSLQNWQIKVYKLENNTVDSNNFLLYHFNNFKYTLEKRTNELIQNKFIKFIEYNQNYIPKGFNYDYNQIWRLLNKYKSLDDYKEVLDRDQRIAYDNIKNWYNKFTINNKDITLDLYFKSIIGTYSKNEKIIISINLNNEKSNNIFQNIKYTYNLKDPFFFTINIAKSENYKIDSSPLYKEKNNQLLFSFKNLNEFFESVNTKIFINESKCLVRIEIPIIYTKTNIQDKIITYIEINNIPFYN